MRHDQTSLTWWRTVANTYLAEVPDAEAATTAYRGHTTRLHTPLGRTAPALEVSGTDLNTLTDTLAGRFAAARAVHASVAPRRIDSGLWKLLATAATLSALAVIIQLAAGATSGWTIFLAAIAVVSAALALPLARWSIRRQTEEFHTVLRRAVDSAGPDAALAYADSGADAHRTIVHNALEGRPLTPKALRTTIQKAAAAGQTVTT